MGKALRCTMAAALLAAAVSCYNTPTIPVPPPDRAQFELTTDPTVPGYVTICAGPNTFPTRSLDEDMVWELVTNITTHYGSIYPCDQDGSLPDDAGPDCVLFEADTGDTITVQSRQNDRESYPVDFTVP